MKKITILNLVQAFGLGAITMAYVADYNRTQLPVALLCLVLGIILTRGDR